MGLVRFGFTKKCHKKSKQQTINKHKNTVINGLLIISKVMPATMTSIFLYKKISVSTRTGAPTAPTSPVLTDTVLPQLQLTGSYERAPTTTAYSVGPNTLKSLFDFEL